jgi:outer membrane putative beta-barrel porin/alpha-amylase
MKSALCLLAVLSSFSTVVRAQDLVPGAYTPAPAGVNVLTIATVFNRGGAAFDPSLPVEDAHATIGLAAVGINRTLNIGDRFASVGVGMPFVVGHVEGRVLDEFHDVSQSGLGDLTARFAINLFGAPAMTPQQFAAYRATTIVGVSLGVAAPVGKYNPTRFINVGTNRWSFKPEVGLSRTRGRWTFEGDIGAVFFTDNTNYVGGRTRQQARIVSFQGHLIRTIRPGFWVAADGNYWKGGRVTTNGVQAAREQKNSRLGITLAVPYRRHQVRVSYSFGAYTTIGGDFHSVGMSYSYVWAARR